MAIKREEIVQNCEVLVIRNLGESHLGCSTWNYGFFETALLADFETFRKALVHILLVVTSVLLVADAKF